MAANQVYFRCPACKRKHRVPVASTRFLCPRTNRTVQPDEVDLTIAPHAAPARKRGARR